MCVCLYAFISGYGLYYSFKKKRNCILYGLKKILKLLVIYWLVLVLVVLPVFVAFHKSFNISELLLNITTIKTTFIHTAWYVRFYIEAILVLIAYQSLPFKKNVISDICIGFVLPMVLYIVLNDNAFSHYFPTLMFGYIFSKYQLFEKYDCIRMKNIFKFGLAIIALMVLFVVRMKFGDMIGPLAVITFMGPFMIYLLQYIVRYISQVNIIQKILMVLSKYSVFIWMLHAIVHCGIASIQKIAYLPYLPLLSVAWSILLMLPISYLLNVIYTKITSRL